MKLRILLILLFLLGLTIWAGAQATTAYHRLNQVLARGNGVYAQIVPYATIAVTNSATGVAGVIYVDPGLTVRVPNSVVTADANGNYGYYFALQLCMTEKITYPNGGMLTFVNVCSNTTSGGSVTGISVGTLPSFLGLTIANPNTTPVLNFTASAIPNSSLAVQTANTVLGAVTATTPSGLPMPACSGGLNALIWNPGVGFGCNTISAGTGTVVTTGSPVSGNLAQFSGPTSITNGNLSGDATTSDSLVVAVVKVNGGAIPTSAKALASNGSNQIIAATLQGTDSALMTAGTVSGTSILLCTDANGGATTSSCPVPLANPMTTAGDMITGGVSGVPQRVGVGTSGQVWAVIAGVPAWAGTVHSSGTNGYYTIAPDGTITDYVNTGSLNNNTPTTITLPHQITSTVMSAVCADNGGRVQSGNDQPVGVNFVGLSAPYTTMNVNTPATGMTAYCIVVGY